MAQTKPEDQPTMTKGNNRVAEVATRSTTFDLLLTEHQNRKLYENKIEG